MTETEGTIQKSTKRKSPLAVGAGIATGLTVGLAGGWILYSNTAIDHNVPLEKAIPAEREVVDTSTAGRLSYYVYRKGVGRPLLLIHSINAAASAYEMWPLFEYYREERTVYALDLPGYGFSERADRVYNPLVFERAILEMMDLVLDEPADVIALSLSCEFAARAALSEPERFHSLTFISPSGFNPPQTGRASQRAKASSGNFLYSALSFPLWGRPLFDLITIRPSIDFFLSQSFVGSVPQSMIDYSYRTAHQPGAHHAPLYFLSGKLFTNGVRSRIYKKVQTPTLVLYDRDPYVDFETLPTLLEKNDAWQAQRIEPTLGLPHFEKLGETTTTLETFWNNIS
ncbi:MAG: alpha/beta hydrolase [Anaerolineae bacterium]